MPSKLTFHISGFDSNVINLLEQVQPSLVKVFDFPSDSNIDEIRRRCPGALIVYRQFTNLDFRDPADAYLAELADTLRKLKGRGIVWEGINEPVLNDAQDAAALAQWTSRFAELMHAQGEKIAAFSFSTANPRLELVPLLGDAATASDYIALHEYYSPTRGAVDLGRYRAFRARLPRAARKPIVITECGLDDGANQGWQKYFSQDQYLANLADYDKIMLKDSYVVGGTIFQYGAGSPWASFNVSPMGAKIAQYAAGQGGGAGRASDEPLQYPSFIYGVHDIGGEGELTSAHRSGWFVDTIDLRMQSSGDYASFASTGVEPIVRLNNGYGTAGTIPPSDQYDAFAAKCAAFVLNSPDARIWVIGNEMNYHDERPELAGGAREVITPNKYASCFLKCRTAIKKVPGHASDWVIPGAVAPYVAETTYPGNERGDWVQYLVDVLNLLGKNVDGIALHCYTHDYHVDQVTWDAKMQPPFTDRHFDFRAYRDFLSALPAPFRQLPVLITETNPIVGWGNTNIGWVQAAYQEVNAWNSLAANQPIQALALFRWKNLIDHPEWSVSSRAAVVDDYRAAIALGFHTSWSQQVTTTISDVQFTPATLVAGQVLQISVTITNNGSAPLATQGPDPGFTYEESDTFYTRNFPEIPGAFRVGVDYDNRSGVDHPYRWGLGTPLAPGETRTITGSIHMKNIQARNFWAGLVQERVAWIQDKQGTRLITVMTPVHITNVSLTPTTLASGQVLSVGITVQNDGSSPLLTQGPDPGFVYDEADTFLSRGFIDVTGNYRIGVDFEGRTGIDHPYRWGLGLALGPGESRVITGAIRLKTIGARNFWAGLVQEHVAWMQDRSGVTAIAVTAAQAAPQITAVTMAPTTLDQGRYLSIAIAVRNDSGVPMATQGPDPGFIYEEGDSFASRGFEAVQGNYRVGVDFDRRGGIDHPYRWGFGTPLAPGETRVITGAIHLKQAQTQNYWAGLVQEYVAWIQDKRGQQSIIVNPGLSILAVSISPTVLSIGQLLNMSITVRNDGKSVLPTQGPNPGFVYDETDTFLSRGFADVTGNYRVAIDSGNRSSVDHPYRWGFGAPLNPGETRTITGAIRVETAQTQNYWAGLVQERLAWLQDHEGITNVSVSATPPPFSFTVTPSAIQLGDSATLEWQVQDSTTVTLDGQPVAAAGSRIVSPTQTTEYDLHIVYTDGSTRDLNVMLTVNQFGLAAMLQFERLPFLKPNVQAGGQSSYDRTGGNADWNNFLGTDANGDAILCDLRGVGTVYRIWATGFDENFARINIYFDGESTPRVSIMMRDLFVGTNAPFLSPLVGDAGVSSGGYYCYVPMSFNASVRITANGINRTGYNFYYNVGYHLYPAGTALQTWTPAEDSSAVRALWTHAGQDPKSDANNIRATGTLSVGGGSAKTIFEIDGPRSLSSIRLQVPGVVANQSQPTYELLDGVWIRIYWDSETSPSVSSPLGSFFGIGEFGTYRARSLAAGIDDSNTLYMYFPMPFERHARVELFNNRSVSVDNVSFEIKHKPFDSPFAQVGNFKTKFNDQVHTQNDGTDVTILDMEGTGHLVGVVLSIRGESNQLFLEGDERIYIDESRTPGIYGTGTEDFFNGGFYFRGGTISLPVHGNTSTIRDASIERIAMYRLFLGDAIPYNKHLTVGIQHGPTNDEAEEAWALAYYYHKPIARAVLTDTLDVGNVVSEQKHSYAVTNQTWSGERPQPYEGADGASIGDTGRGHKGDSRFVMAIQPANTGVILRRRMDFGVGNQAADVYVDGTRVGAWYRAGSNAGRWRDDDFRISAAFTAGKSSIILRIVFVSSDADWNEFTYWVYSLS